MEVSNRIREERERLGLSQEALAREIYVSRQTVSNWETGKTYPDVQSLLLLSNLFDVSVDSLVRGDMEAMESNIENYELQRFKLKASTGLSLALIVLGAAMLAILCSQGADITSPLAIVAVAVTAAGAAVSLVADHVKKQYNFETMSEVKAFLDGAEPDQIIRNRRMPKAASVALKVLAGAVMGIALMMVLYLVIALTHLA